eukprot:1548590-Pleurochrysis_carterae.AAC.2
MRSLKPLCTCSCKASTSTDLGYTAVLRGCLSLQRVPKRQMPFAANLQSGPLWRPSWLKGQPAVAANRCERRSPFWWAQSLQQRAQKRLCLRQHEEGEEGSVAAVVITLVWSWARSPLVEVELAQRGRGAVKRVQDVLGGSCDSEDGGVRELARTAPLGLALAQVRARDRNALAAVQHHAVRRCNLQECPRAHAQVWVAAGWSCQHAVERNALTPSFAVWVHIRSLADRYHQSCLRVRLQATRRDTASLTSTASKNAAWRKVSARAHARTWSYSPMSTVSPFSSGLRLSPCSLSRVPVSMPPPESVTCCRAPRSCCTSACQRAKLKYAAKLASNSSSVKLSARVLLCRLAEAGP